MASVYILYSPGENQFYTGSCKDLDFRLRQHFEKSIHGAFTSKTSDWELFHTIGGLQYQQARKIENHIKKMKSRKFIRDLKLFPEITKRLLELYPA